MKKEIRRFIKCSERQRYKGMERRRESDETRYANALPIGVYERACYILRDGYNRRLRKTSAAAWRAALSEIEQAVREIITPDFTFEFDDGELCIDWNTVDYYISIVMSAFESELEADAMSFHTYPDSWRAKRHSAVPRRVMAYNRSRARSIRRAGRHVSHSFVTDGIGSDKGGDDGGDGQSDSDCNRAFVLWGKGEFCVVSARLGGLSLNDRINVIIVSRYRALLAQARGAQGDGRFFVPFWRWTA